MKNFDILKSRLIIVPVFLASIVASVYLLQIVFSFLSQFSWLFIIFLYAYLVYVIIGPLDRLLKKTKINSQFSLVLSFIIVFAILTLTIIVLNSILPQEVSVLAEQIKTTNFNSSIESILGNIAQVFNIDQGVLRANILNTIRDFGGSITSNILGILSNALLTFIQIILALIFGYFFIKDGGGWFKSFLKIIPKSYRDEVRLVSEYLNTSAKSFLSIQLLMAFIYAICNFLIMNLLGIKFALTSSIIAFLTFIIPGIGPGLSALVPISVTLLFDANKLVLLVVLLLVIQQVILNILIPKFYGNKVGVHPLVVLLSILVGIQLFGVLGAFIVIPIVTVVINVVDVYYIKRQGRN